MLTDQQLRRAHPELGEARRRPASRVVLRRLGHQQDALGSKEASGALGEDARRTEGPGHHQIEAGPHVILSGEVLCPSDRHRRPIRDPQITAGLLEELAAAGGAVEQDHRAAGPALEEHQARDAPARAEVEHPRGLLDPQAREHGDEAEGVLDVRLDRPRAEEAKLTTPEEQLLQGPGPGR